MLRQGTGETKQEEASPSPRQGKVWRFWFCCLIALLCFALSDGTPGGCPLHELRWFLGGQFSTQEDSPFGRQGLPSSHVRTPAWCWTGNKDLPDINVLLFEGSPWSGPSVLGVPGSWAPLQTCPNRLLMGCLQAGPRQPDRQWCARESTCESAARVHPWDCFLAAG